MKLAGHKHNPPSRNALSVGSLQDVLECQKGSDIRRGKQPSHHELCMLEADESNNGLPYTREKHSTEKRARHSPGEREMIIGV